jgi:hypothetical protein
MDDSLHDLTPPLSLEGDYEITNATNPQLNGWVKFRHLTAMQRVRIGSRTEQLLNLGRPSPVAIESVPNDALLMARAIATLEAAIKEAPGGFYLQPTEQNPNPPKVLRLGDIGGSEAEANDDMLIYELFNEYNSWQKKIKKQ